MMDALESHWLLITGGDIILPGGDVLPGGTVVIQEGRIFEVLEEAPGSLLLEESHVEVINAEGCWVTPGLIDQHMHGANGIDFNLSSIDEIRSLLFQLPLEGVTALVPTLITGPKLDLVLGLSNLEEVIHMQDLHQARVLGLHLEGPFLSPHYRGAHPAEDLLMPTMENLEGLLSPSLKRITIAPELDPGCQVIHLLSQQGVLCSIGHSGCDYETALQAINAGASCITHLFNAMPHLHHREPGLAMAGLICDDIYVELIGDCVHVAPPMLHLAMKTKPFEKSILVSDCTALAGLPHGSTFTFGKQLITVESNGSRDPSGKLVGSSQLLSGCIRHMVQTGMFSFPEVIQFATTNPARYLGVLSNYGQIAPDTVADIVLWRKDDLQIQSVLLAGEPAKSQLPLYSN